PGRVSIYEFLRDTGRGEEPAWLADALREGDPGSTISRMGLEQKSPLCVEALHRFVGLYGSEAGNAALKLMATGGVYLGGGIAPRIVSKLADGTFRARFLAKGRMRPLLESMPVRVVLNDQAGLLGAGRCAAGRVEGESALSGRAPAPPTDAPPPPPQPPRPPPSAAGSPRSCRGSAPLGRARPRSPATAAGRGCSGRAPRSRCCRDRRGARRAGSPSR